MNVWLLERCADHARCRSHAEVPVQTVFEAFEAERTALVSYAGPFDGYRATVAAVSKTCLVRFDHNRYSVPARVVGGSVEVNAYGEQVVIRQNGQIVAQHARHFGRGQTAYDPRHYVPVLSRKPGALRNGAPFKDWALPGALAQIQRRLKQ